MEIKQLVKIMKQYLMSDGFLNIQYCVLCTLMDDLLKMGKLPKTPF